MKSIKFSIIGLVLGTASFGPLFAQNVEQIHMKSGSVVEGYISEQKPGKYITIQTTKATIVVNSDSLQNRVIEKIPIESLSKEWREWAEKNNKCLDSSNGKVLELSSLEFEHSRYSRVFLLEKGSLIKFVDMSPNRYTFVWGDIYRTVKSRRPDNLFSGLKEILVLKDNSKIEGQIIEQFPGKDLKIVTSNDEVLSYKFSQIKQIRTERLSEKLDLWNQIQLLDRINVKGEDSELEGFISSRTLSKDLVIEFENGGSRKIPLNEVTSYAKFPNDKYKAVYDRVIQKDSVYLNGSSAYFDTLIHVGQYLTLTNNVSAKVAVGDTICIEANLGNSDVPVTLVKAHIEKVPNPRAKNKKSSTIPWPVITFQDLIQAPLPYKREITPLGNVKIEFVVVEAGDYVVYIQGKEGYIVINVE